MQSLYRAAEYISSLERINEYVLEKRYERCYWSKRFKKTARRAGLAEEIHLHCLRHTYITRLVGANVHVYDVRKLARHTSISTTMRYYHAKEDKLLKEADKSRFFDKSPADIISPS